MKQTRKLLAMLLCIAMVLGMAITVFAAEGDPTITVPDDGHTYEVYQIFTGDLHGQVLSNIIWGQNGTGYVANAETPVDTDTLNALLAVVNASNVDKLDVINDCVDFESTPIATLPDNGKLFVNVAPGYYLIKDKDGTVSGNDAYTTYIVEIVGNVTINPKSEVPEMDKIISADNNNISGDITSDGKFDNVSIGSKVEYTLTANIPSNAGEYDYFYFIINDTLSTGLTFNNDITVTIGGEEVVLNTDYYVYTGENADGNTFQVALKDARAHAGKTVVVKYTATLNENAVIGEIDGNPNNANLDFSNNPNYDYNGDKEPGTPPDDDEPGKPGKTPDDKYDVPMGETPDKVTRTYTTGLKLIKVDENGNILTGAEFKIEGENLVEILTVETVEYQEDAEGKYWALKDGSYTTDAPVAEHYEEKNDNREGGYVKEGDTYRVATDEELADENVQLYTKVESNEALYQDTTTKYSVKKVTYTNKETVANKTYTAEVNDKGELILTGLGEGTYTITETKEPDGYNKLNGSIVVDIQWTEPSEGNNCDWTATATYQGKSTELNMTEGGIFELEIENKAGSTLPETGGIGTTLFYVFGGIMVLGAAVLLVTKKRMAA